MAHREKKFPTKKTEPQIEAIIETQARQVDEVVPAEVVDADSLVETDGRRISRRDIENAEALDAETLEALGILLEWKARGGL